MGIAEKNNKKNIIVSIKTPNDLGLDSKTLQDKTKEIKIPSISNGYHKFCLIRDEKILYEINNGFISWVLKLIPYFNNCFYLEHKFSEHEIEVVFEDSRDLCFYRNYFSKWMVVYNNTHTGDIKVYYKNENAGLVSMITFHNIKIKEIRPVNLNLNNDNNIEFSVIFTSTKIEYGLDLRKENNNGGSK